MKHIYFILAAIVGSCSFATGQITPPSAAPITVDSVTTDAPPEGPGPAEVIIEKSEPEEVPTIEAFADKFVPRRASLYAAILPGAGQIYTRKYWKLPLVYGGFVALGMAVDFYNVRYKLLREELFRTLDNPGYTSQYGNERQLRAGVDSQRRDRDFYILMIGVLYFLQIADAHIDAHLKEFELNPNLQVTLEPAIERSEYIGSSAGLALVIKF